MFLLACIHVPVHKLRKIMVQVQCVHCTCTLKFKIHILNAATCREVAVLDQGKENFI